MQHLDNLWKLVSAASTVRDLALEARELAFVVQGPTTFYLHAEQADISIRRHNEPQLRARARLQAAFGWRLLSDQDEAGIYIVARRRAVVGGLSRAAFEITTPLDTYLMLRLENCTLRMEDLHGLLEIPPSAQGHNIIRQL